MAGIFLPSRHIEYENIELGWAIDAGVRAANTCVVPQDRGVHMSSSGFDPVRERHWVCARRLRERRLMQGLTQREVVGRLERRGVRTTNRALSTMENGRGLDLGLLPELAEALDCTVTYLLGLASDPQSWSPDRTLRLIEEMPSGFSAQSRTRLRGASTTSDGGETGLSANN
jgi:transcriptional regulator with XRE-family HTH domain